MARTAVDPYAYESAATVFGRDIAEGLFSAWARLNSGLAEAGSMAGSDPAGHKFSAAYDKAANEVNAVSQDVINGCYKLAGLLSSTGFNHGKANYYSRPGVAPLSADTKDPVKYGQESVQLAGLPSSSGDGGTGHPHGWWLIEHTPVGYLWPNGSSGRLHVAATAWSAAAGAITELAGRVPDAAGAIAEQQSIEVAPATIACNAMARHLDALAAAYHSMSRACTDYANYVDTCHRKVIDELESLVEWTAGIEGIGLLGAIVTCGASEGAAQAAEATRIGISAARVGSFIAELSTAVVEVTDSIATLADAVISISQELQTLLGADQSLITAEGVGKLATTPSAAEQAAVRHLQAHAGIIDALPPFYATPKQLQKKYWHAVDDFGMPEHYSPAKAVKFSVVLKEFVDDPGTTTLPGFFNKEPAILSYNPETLLIVIRHPDGSFWSGWQMEPAVALNVFERGRIGGHK